MSQISVPTTDTRNETDVIAADPAAAGNLLHTVADGDGTLGLVVLGVDPGADPGG